MKRLSVSVMLLAILMMLSAFMLTGCGDPGVITGDPGKSDKKPTATAAATQAASPTGSGQEGTPAVTGQAGTPSCNARSGDT